MEGGRGEEKGSVLKGSHLKCWPLTRSGEKYLKTVTLFLFKKRHGPLGVHGLAYRVAIDTVSRHTRCTVAEICDLNQAVAVEQHVAGLDVAVYGVFRLVQIPCRVKLEKYSFWLQDRARKGVNAPPAQIKMSQCECVG